MVKVTVYDKVEIATREKVTDI